MSARRQKPEDQILYVYYDRICPKAVKKRSIARRYGPQYGYFADEGTSAPSRGTSGAGTSPNRNENGARTAYSANRDGGEYLYRPAAAAGGEAVRERPLKILLEKVVNLFETIEERGRQDVRIAKQRAIAMKKLSELRHAILTALILILVAALFLFCVYRLFFVIEDVAVEGTEIYTADEVVDCAGFAVGDNLYSFSAGTAEEDITFRCPYVKSAEISRTVPRSVEIALEDDTAVFCANIWGDCVKLSEGLRVLEVVPADKADTDGLIELVLPPVSASVGGRILQFAESKNERYVRDVLTGVVKSELALNGRVTKVDLSDRYNLSLIADGKYTMRLGGESDCDLKLKLAAKTIASVEFDSDREASIDISSADHAIVRYRSGQITD